MAEIQQRGSDDDRRTRQRFPLQLAMRYRRKDSSSFLDWIDSTSVNISSTGLLFTTNVSIPAGESVEAFIVWPMSLDKRIPLKLIVKGSVARTDGEHCAMRFETYEFKTRNIAEPFADLEVA